MRKATDNVLAEWAAKESGAIPDLTVTTIRDGCRTTVVSRVIAAAFAGRVGVDQAPRIAVTLVGMMLSDDSFRAKLEVAVQENAGIEADLGVRVDQLLPTLAANPMVGVNG